MLTHSYLLSRYNSKRQGTSLQLSMRLFYIRIICSVCIIAAILLQTWRMPEMGITGIDDSLEHESIPFQQELNDRNMTLSLRQQRKFQMKKNLVPEVFQKEMLYTFDSRWHSLIINDHFAYRHIFKNGGSTVKKQTGSNHVKKSQVGDRIVVASVRDPIGRFLSGWAECGERNKEYMEYNKTADADYDARIQLWLKRTKSLARKDRSCRRSLQCMCGYHSLPQANFMLTRKKQIDNKIRLVGDLKELTDLLAVTGFQYNAAIESSRNATTSSLKTQYFPIKKHLITDETMRSICEFLSMDYFLFDYTLPVQCRNQGLP